VKVSELHYSMNTKQEDKCCTVILSDFLLAYTGSQSCISNCLECLEGSDVMLI
jgi:hypothetical protein